jgi:cyclase
MVAAVEAGGSAVLAASIFHFGEYTVREVKEHMSKAGVPIR